MMNNLAELLMNDLTESQINNSIELQINMYSEINNILTNVNDDIWAPSNSNTYRQCINCYLFKPGTEFTLNQSRCRSCRSLYMKEWYIKNRLKKNIKNNKTLQSGFIDITLNKTCRICHINKPIFSFNKHKTTRDGVRSDCKICQCRSVINARKNYTPQQRAIVNQKARERYYKIKYYKK